MGSTNNQFTIDLPGDWEDQTIHLFMGPDDSGVQHMMQLSIDPDVETTNLGEYARGRIDAALESLQGAEILKEEEKIMAGGRNVYECVYRWIPVDGEKRFQKAIYFIDDGVAYTFTANFSKKTIKTIGVEVDRMIESFQPGIAPDDEE